MSKKIKMQEIDIERAVKEFREVLMKGFLSDGKINYSKDIGVIEKKAKLHITEKAQLKMRALVDEHSKEIAWHGIAKRTNPCEYIIEDILCFPQEVTGVTVTTDQEGYEKWLYGQPDEVFNNVRMQGHSHVNMGTTPSSTDLALYDGILEQLSEGMFYIFMILNKKGDNWIRIFDYEENVQFDTKDIEVSYGSELLGIQEFIKDSRQMVKDKPATTTYINRYYNNTPTQSTVTPLASANPMKTQPKKEIVKPSTFWDDTQLSDPFYSKGY